jgi:chromate reductase
MTTLNQTGFRMISRPIRILGIAGSLRRNSFNRATLHAAATLAPKDSVLEPFELDAIPLFNRDDERSPPPKVSELKRRIREANAILFVTPAPRITNATWVRSSGRFASI